MQKKGQVQLQNQNTMPSGRIEVQTAPLTPPVQTKIFGILGLIFGLIGLAILNFQVYIGLITGILGFILCFMQSKKGKTGLSKIGLIISAVTVIWAALIIVSRILMA